MYIATSTEIIHEQYMKSKKNHKIKWAKLLDQLVFVRKILNDINMQHFSSLFTWKKKKV